MYISKTRFINWTKCPMCFPMELKYNPAGKEDIDLEKERRQEMMEEMRSAMSDDEAEDSEEYDASPSEELEALLPYYNRVEDEALKIAKKYFTGIFIADHKNVHNQKLFEYQHDGHTYRCYVDIYNENSDEINIIEVKATTSGKYEDLTFSEERNGDKYPLFVKSGNILRLNSACSKIGGQALQNFNKAKQKLLDRYELGKYPHDLAFQRFVIENALHKAGESRKVNFYLAVLNKRYVYDGALDEKGNNLYNKVDGQELIVFIDLNDISGDFQPIIKREIATLESYISTPHDINARTPVGKWCFWGKNTECLFLKHCFKVLRDVPDTNRANNYSNFRGFKAGDIKDKYQLINEGYYKFDDIPVGWLEKENHKIQRDCYDKGQEYADREKMSYWLENVISYPIYHLDFETFPCPLPRFRGENPYRQSVFEFSLHIERSEGVCDKEKDNFIFLNANANDDEREELVKAIIDHFEFNDDGTLRGTMLAQNTSFEKSRLKELASLFPGYRDKLLAICDRTADLIHLLKTNKDIYSGCFPDRADVINYYHRDLSGSYSIKKTLPVLVPSLTYKGMEVGNGVQAYISYLNYDSPDPTFGVLKTKEERRAALSRYCQQDTWAMVEILRAVRRKSRQ